MKSLVKKSANSRLDPFSYKTIKARPPPKGKLKKKKIKSKQQSLE